MEHQRIDSTEGELPEGYRQGFQGDARFQFFASPFVDREGGGPAVFAVHFDAGARTRPHVHRSGQVLVITDGEGIVADRSGRRLVTAGDVVTVEPDEWHWHGATPGSPMTHVTVQIPGTDDVSFDVAEEDWATGYGSPQA